MAWIQTLGCKYSTVAKKWEGACQGMVTEDKCCRKASQCEPYTAIFYTCILIADIIVNYKKYVGAQKLFFSADNFKNNELKFNVMKCK